MSPEHGNPSANTHLLAAIADPAVELDASGRILAWNDAAAARFAIDATAVGADPEELLARWRGGARRVALANGDGGGLIVWSLDEAGLGPEEVERSKADVVGRISGSALHELNNLLGLGMGVGGLIKTEPGLSRDTYEMAADLETQGQRAHGVANALLGFSRSRRPRTTIVKIGPIVRQSMEVLGHATVDMKPRVTAPDSLPEVEVDEGELRHALFAILVNALEAQGVTWYSGAPTVPGRLIVSASHRDDTRGNRIRVAIEDGGAPVPEEQRTGLFDGTAERSSRDLVVARALIERLGGRLSYEPVAGGNRMVLDLPVAGTSLPPPAEELTAAKPVVLLCDDDVFIRSLLVRMMDRRGYQSIEARSGEDALAVVTAQHVDLVIADGKLPDLPGDAIYRALVAARPSIAARIVFMSGDPSDAELAELSARTGAPVLAKPFDNAKLDDLIRAALES